MQGNIFNIQRFCVNDGPGIRTTVFFKGCPLSCTWCHNPESQSFEPEILFYRDKCTGCGRCKNLTVNNADFICFNGAKEIFGKTVDSDYVISEVLKDKIFYDSSDGGMTLSGGEPLSQPEFTLELLKKAKEYKIHTALETCGFANTEVMRKAAELTDLFLFDYKETDPILHKKITGQDNILILNNLNLLNVLGKRVILRCPIIPGFNDRDNHFLGISKTANCFECIEHIEIEPYHSLGAEKYEALGRKHPNIAVPEAAAVEGWLEKLRSLTEKEVKRA